MSGEFQTHPVIAACAAQRAATSTEYTIADAIHDARFLRRVPEAVVSDAQAKRLIGTLFAAIDGAPAFLKALERGQEVFVLVEQDRAAPYAIRQWAEVAENHGTGPEKVLDAKLLAKRWSESPLPAKKWPT
jgi:hypothetical protein